MNGIQYIVDSKGKKTAVVIELKKHMEMWEDFEDQLVAEKRKHQKRYTHEEVTLTLKESR